MMKAPLRKRTSKSEPALNEGLRSALESALSAEELSRTATAALLALDDAGRHRMLAQLPPETVEALLPILEVPRGGKSLSSAPKAGKAKVRETWQGLWAEWNECIEESGDEKGRYVQQDEHWSAPYLDEDGVVDDLEAIAKRMREIVGRVWADGLDPELSFLGEVREAADGIGSGLPEWFQHEGAGFGQQVTGCLLEWEWRVAQREGLDAFGFVERIRNFEMSLRDASLNGGGIVGVVAAMPQDDQRVVFEGLKNHRASAAWSEVLAQVHSAWFRIHLRLARKWDQARYAQSCRAHIAQDWALALPLVSEQIRKKAYPEALVLIDEAMRALLRLGPTERWDPTNELLVGRRSFGFSPQSDGDAFRLLGSWQKATAALGDNSVAAALGVQCAIGGAWEDWDRVIDTFKRAKPPCDALFAAWQSLVARASIAVERGDEDLQLEWVRLLAGAAKGELGRTSFLGAMRRWLSRVDTASGDIDRFKGSLATLLLDLDVGGRQLKGRYPKLRGLLDRQRRGDDALQRARRRSLERLGGSSLFSEVLDVMKKHIAAFVPDPAAALGSNYRGCAEWMAAMHELAPEEHAKLLSRWQELHPRRRSLWKALSAIG